MGIWTGYQRSKAKQEAREDKQATLDISLRRLELLEEQFTESKRQTTLEWISKYQQASGDRNKNAKTRAATLQKLKLMGGPKGLVTDDIANFLIDSGEAAGIVKIYEERVGKTLSADWIPSLVEEVSKVLSDKESPQAKAMIASIAIKSAILNPENQMKEEGQQAALMAASFDVISGRESGIENLDEQLAQAIFKISQPEQTITLPPIGSYLTRGSQAINSDERVKIEKQIISSLDPILGSVFVKDPVSNEYTSSIDVKQLGPVSAEDLRELLSNTTQKIIDRLERVSNLNPSDIIDQEIDFSIDLARSLKKTSSGNSVGAANTSADGIGNIMTPPSFVTSSGLTKEEDAFDPYGSITTERIVP
tara:strand:- start:63 stop:1154 length:1092 start_codon:yes stop_codon:yes gene_type:complete